MIIAGWYNRDFSHNKWANLKGSGQSYTNELLVDDTSMTYHLHGMYSDLYVRENGQWMFAERIFKKLHIDHPY